MRYIKLWLPETTRAQGWKNPKFHFLTHFVDMIICYGAPKNYDSQCPEHNQKYNAKYQDADLGKQIMLQNLKNK